MNAQGGIQGEDIVSQIKTWFENCPLFTKGLIYISSIVAVLSMVTDSDLYLSNLPAYVVEGFQIHRLFTSPIASHGILSVLFGFFAVLPQCARQEREWGTVKTIVDFLWKNFIINIIYVIMAYALSPITPLFVTRISAAGLWQIFFFQLVERSLQNPEGVSMLLCFPVQIKTKYYPIALWLIFSLLSQLPRIDNLAAMVVGYLHFKYLNDRYFAFLSDTRMSNWSDKFLFAWMKNYNNYASASGASTTSSVPAGRTPGPVIGRVSSGSTNSNSTAATNQPPANFFSGKGVAIGGGTDMENPPPRNPNTYMPLQDDISDLENSAENRGN